MILDAVSFVGDCGAVGGLFRASAVACRCRLGGVVGLRLMTALACKVLGHGVHVAIVVCVPALVHLLLQFGLLSKIRLLRSLLLGLIGYLVKSLLLRSAILAHDFNDAAVMRHALDSILNGFRADLTATFSG